MSEVNPWQSLAIEIVKNVVVPKLMEYTENMIKNHNRTPTREELESQASLIVAEIQARGKEFLEKHGTTGKSKTN